MSVVHLCDNVGCGSPKHPLDAEFPHEVFILLQLFRDVAELLCRAVLGRTDKNHIVGAAEQYLR